MIYMKTKFIKRSWRFLCLGLFLVMAAGPAEASIDYAFQSQYPVTDYEQGSRLLNITLAITPLGEPSPVRIGGITMNIDNFDTAVFNNPSPQDLFTTMDNGDLWQTNPGPGAVVGAGGIIQYTKAAVGATPLAAGLGRTLTGTTSLYRLPFSIREAAPDGATAISFERTNNRAQNQNFANYTLNQPAATYNIISAQPPQGFSFSAPAASVADLETGNGVRVNWTALPNTINTSPGPGNPGDLTPPITYDIFRDDSPLPTGAALDSFRIVTGDDGNYDFGDAGGAASFTDSGLSDGITYYYKMRAKDSASSNDELDRHRTTYTDNQELSITPHDYTAPPAVTGVAVSSTGDRQVALSWNASAHTDVGGYIVIRRAGSPVTILDPANSLGRAGGNTDGPDPSTNYTRGTSYSDGIVVAQRVGRNTTTFTDVLGGGDPAALALVNGTTYFYTVIAYDRAVAGPPREQGFNYSVVDPAASVTSGTPGVAPAPVTNFTAVAGGPGQITLSWNNSTSNFFQGVLIRYVTIADPTNAAQMAAWDDLDDRNASGDLTQVTGATLVDWARPASGAGSNTGERVNITLSADTAGAPLVQGTTYYFMAFAHNGSGRHASGVKASAMPGITPGVGSVSSLRIQIDPASGNSTLTFTPVTLAADRVIEAYAAALPQGPFDADPVIGTDADGDGSIVVSDGAILERYYKVRVSGSGPWSPETVGKIRLGLSTGINSVAIPFVTTITGNSPLWTEMTANGLRADLNGTTPAVTYVAGWAGNQSEYARLYSLADGSITDVGGQGNFAIDPEIGYQVNVNTARNWWIVGQR
jgi:hypothetical protein